MPRRRHWIILTILIVFSVAVYVSLYRKYQRDIYRPHVSIIGFVKMADGIGRQSVELLDIMKQFTSVRFQSTKNEKKKDLREDLQRYFHESGSILGDVIIYEDNLNIKDETVKKFMSQAKDHQIRIAFSVFESSRIPPEWAFDLNLFFDAVIVPDPYYIDVYKNSGVQIPIFYLPLGRDYERFLEQPLKKKRGTPFVFGNFGRTIDRKNLLTIVEAFAKAFGDDPRVHLKINCRQQESSKYERKLQNLILKLGLPNIFLTYRCLSDEMYLKSLMKIDCLVNLSKGEGFSIQPREAMALGIPAIVTDNTAQSTICQSGLVRSVRSEQEETAFYPYYDDHPYGKHYQCSIEDAAEAMHDVYENYEHYLSLGEAMRQWARKYDYSLLKRRYRTLIKPKKIVLGDHNEIGEEVLTTNSEELYKKYLMLKAKKKF